MTTETRQAIPVRLKQHHQDMLRELQDFWGDNQSDAIRRAIETEYAFLQQSLRHDEENARNLGGAHWHSVRERYQEALAELRKKATAVKNLIPAGA